MPSCARRKSQSNIYHVMIRGVNRQRIFQEEADYQKFIRILKECKEISCFELYAYCLMPNHVHLLIKDCEEPLERIMRRIGSRYVYWYNLKHHRSGHLFQDRYRSEAVEDDAYFLTVLRYIIQNPMKAGLEKYPGHYPWSSYYSYLGVSDYLTDVKFAFRFFSSPPELLYYFNTETDETGMDITDTTSTRDGVTDETAGEIFYAITGCRTAEEFKSLEKQKQTDYIKKLLKENLSKRQIARITGKSRTTIP